MRTLRRRIEDGRYPVGSALPGRPALAREFGTSSYWIEQALPQLRTENVLALTESPFTAVPLPPDQHRDACGSPRSSPDRNRTHVPLQRRPHSPTGRVLRLSARPGRSPDPTPR
ncbi:GntR family transcriptional regulator [Streptomyces sp. NPDC059092]|uniref:GntR family transcriptional regulator n=1 Tax=Streptomyces sp. NPDC059092 TaxID=3346725 RepID=UPI0036748A09